MDNILDVASFRLHPLNLKDKTDDNKYNYSLSLLNELPWHHRMTQKNHHLLSSRCTPTTMSSHQAMRTNMEKQEFLLKSCNLLRIRTR